MTLLYIHSQRKRKLKILKKFFKDKNSINVAPFDKDLAHGKNSHIDSRVIERRFFYYVFHIRCQKYLFTNLNLPYQNSKMFFTSNDKNIYLKMWNFFCHLMWKMFCHFYRANSIKTNLLTCNLWTKWSVSYKSVNLFWLNLPYRNGKTFSTSNGKKSVVWK